MKDLFSDRIDIVGEHRRLDEEFKQRRAALGQSLREEQDRQRQAENKRMAALREDERLAQLKSKHRASWIVSHAATPATEYDKAATWKPWVEEREAEERRAGFARLKAAVRL